MDIVKSSLEYFDKNMEIRSKTLSKFKFVKIITNTNIDMDRNIIIFYDKNGTELHKSKYERLGTYYNLSNTWIWSWANPTRNKNETYISKNILKYGLDIDVDKSKSDFNDMMFIKTELVTSRFRISDPIQLDVHIALSSYISKIPLIIPFVYIAKDKKEKPSSLKKFYSNYIDAFKHKNFQISFFFILDDVVDDVDVI